MMIVLLLVVVFTLPASASLKFGILPDDAAIPLIVAREMGLFEEAGYDMKLVPFNTAIERDSALQAGEIDGTIADIVATAFAVENGRGLKITALANSRFTMLAAADSGITSYEELKDVKIAISSNTVIEYLTDRFFAEHGFEHAELDKIVIPKIPVRLQMLMAGKVLAATLPEPLASLARSEGAKVMGSTEEIGGAPVVMVFTQKAIDNKTVEIQAFYDAYSQAVDLVNDNHEDYRDLIVKKGRFPASIKDVFQFASYDQPHLPEPEMVKEVLLWMEENNLLKSKLEYNDLVSDKFVN